MAAHMIDDRLLTIDITYAHGSGTALVEIKADGSVAIMTGSAEPFAIAPLEWASIRGFRRRYVEETVDG